MDSRTPPQTIDDVLNQPQLSEHPFELSADLRQLFLVAPEQRMDLMSRVVFGHGSPRSASLGHRRGRLLPAVNQRMRQTFDHIAILETFIALGGRRSGFRGLVVGCFRVSTGRLPSSGTRRRSKPLELWVAIAGLLGARGGQASVVGTATAGAAY